MNYSTTYEKLIASAKANPPVGYCEVHHIVPRCIGGGNEQDNLVSLSARQHFVAHQILAKIHGGKLIAPAYMMSKNGKHSSHDYEWLRIRHCKNLEGNKYGEALRGYKHSAQTKANMSRAQKGLPSQIKGRTFGPRKKRKSQECRDLKSASMKALWVKRHAEGFKQAKPRPRSAEANAKISAKKMGHEVSPETREKIRLAVLANIEKRRAEGYKYPKNRKTISAEARAKIAQSVRDAAIRRRANAALENQDTLT